MKLSRTDLHRMAVFVVLHWLYGLDPDVLIGLYYDGKIREPETRLPQYGPDESHEAWLVRCGAVLGNYSHDVLKAYRQKIGIYGPGEDLRH
jgi:hypothetical protein